MKVRTLLVAAVMFLALSAAAFAQATFQVGSIPVTTVTNTGQTEKTGDITFTQLAGGTSVAGTITISYGVPITIPAANVIISAATGATYTTDGTNTGTVNINSVDKAGTVVINVPGGATSGSFTLSGVRVAVAGTSLTNLTATVSSVNNAILAGQTNVVVINAIAAGLTSVGSSGTEASINGVTGGVTGTAALTAYENYLDAFGPSTTTDTTLTVGRIVRFTLSAAPPEGVEINFPATASIVNAGTEVSATSFVLVDPADDYAALGAKVIEAGDTDLSAYYMLATTSNATAIEYISVPVTLTIASTPRPIGAATITYTATLAPIGTAFDADGDVISDPIPRFVASEIGTGTLLSVTGSKTSMLFPFAGTVEASGFDTGIAIANTTADPGETALGYAEAVAQAGTITYYFYNAQAGTTAPTVTTYTTTAGSPGTGLDSTGSLPSGSTYSVLLTQLLTAAGFTGDFSGYVFAVANFTNAHGQYVLTDFKAFANGGQALIIGADRDSTPEILGQ